VEHVKAERTLMTILQHPFIIPFLTAFEDERHLYIVMEFAAGGELFAHIREQGRLTNDSARFYGGELILALEHMHVMQIAYRDIKPGNCLLDGEGHLKLTDFGFAKALPLRGSTHTMCGTAEYLAPEMILGKGHDKAVDWWAFGVLLFEMLSGYPPFHDESPYGIYKKVLDVDYTMPRHLDVKVKDLIHQFLVKDPLKRIGVRRRGPEEVKKHQWLKGLDWDMLINRTVPPPYVPKLASADDTSMYSTFPEDSTDAPMIDRRQNALFEGFASEIS